jgi:glycosyltransferase involved in cell wall biosynthesis
MSKLKIWVVQPSEQLPIDCGVRRLRTRLLAEELASRGHEVTWWASCFNHLRKQWYFDQDTIFEPIKGVTIHALKGIGYSKNVSLRRVLDHSIITNKFKNQSELAERPDVIVTSFPPHNLANAAVSYAADRHIPVAVDVRDKWPDNFVDVLPARLKGIGRLVLKYEFYKRNQALTRAQAIYSMTEHILSWGLKCANRKRTNYDKVFYLGSYRESNTVVPEQIQRLIAERFKGCMVVTFVGTFSTYHNPEAAIQVAKKLQSIPNLVFVFMGDGDLRPTLNKMAQGLGNVVFTGWADSASIAAVLKQSHLGLCTSGKTSERNFLPNKVFSYLAEGVPLASVFDGELRDLINKHQFGFNFFSVEELTKGVLRLYENRVLLEEMAERARFFFNEHCDAASIYNDYADWVERLAKNSHKYSSESTQLK